MDRRGFRVEIAHQVEHAVTHAGDIDADVLNVETFGEFLDLGGLVGERMPPPAVLLQNPEPRPGLQRRGHHHAGGIVAGAAGIVAKPHRAVAERPLCLRIRIVVSPQALV